jgi:RHH-type proline utilization regulon transcriptional repressor/proline dehydrogenase/delta 1-pyrroline-5-carboxylate dehydrogenase
VQQRIRVLASGLLQVPELGAMLQHGTAEQVQTSCEALALRPGPIVGLQSLAPGERDFDLDRLVLERSLSVNTAAAGGNASLMTIG